ncbi:MAG: hypothetical protein CL920_37420 [Deltaproteobacteria bacterium]|nr:hypothetical protein [Deltaproteobacteria bacterium]
MTGSFEKKFQALCEHYERQIPQKIKDIEVQFEALIATPSDKDGWSMLRNMVHQIAGSAPTFGFRALGQSAKNFEAVITNRIQLGHHTDDDQERLHALFQDLKSNASLDSEHTQNKRWTQSYSSTNAPDTKVTPAAPFPVQTRKNHTEISVASGAQGAEHPTILLVEDDPFLMQMMTMSLSEDGYACHVAEDGETALQLAKKLRPELILLDLMLPKVDGFSVCNQLRKTPSLHDVPIIILTSSVSESDIIKAYELGADDYLTKPVNTRVLLAKIKRLVHKNAETHTSASGLHVGSILDNRYEIQKVLGEGAMGIVYLANHIGLHIPLAVKVFKGKKDSTAMERFQREIQTLARLSHPNLISVHDSGHAHDLHYYSMDYAPGGTLWKRLETSGPLPIQQALEWLAKIADALQIAHDHEILHRDIEAENIIISKDGEPMLTDFGVILDLKENRLTQEGYIVGTPQYMAPEQIIDPKKVDKRSDIYSLGVLLFEMLVGHTPLYDIPANSVFFIIMCGTLPKVRQFAPDIPEEIEAFCMECLSLDPEDRPQSAKEVAEQALALLQT